MTPSQPNERVSGSIEASLRPEQRTPQPREILEHPPEVHDLGPETDEPVILYGRLGYITREAARRGEQPR
jgi:hypothetical protein